MNKVELNTIFSDSKKIREDYIPKMILKDQYQEVKIHSKSIQKQTRSGQTTRQKTLVAVGNNDGYVGLACGRGKDVALSVVTAAANARRNMIAVRRGYWGDQSSTSHPHTIPNKVTGKSGSVSVRLMPAPPGAGIVANKTHSIILKLCGIEDCYVKSRGYTATRENHAKALFHALAKTYSFYPSHDWNNNNNQRSMADTYFAYKNDHQHRQQQQAMTMRV